MLSSHSRLQAHPGARSQHWGWVGPVSTQTCEHGSMARCIRGEREGRAVYKHRVPWRTLPSPGCPHPRRENTAGKLCFGNRGSMNENLCRWESKGKKPHIKSPIQNLPANNHQLLPYSSTASRFFLQRSTTVDLGTYSKTTKEKKAPLTTKEIFLPCKISMSI